VAYDVTGGDGGADVLLIHAGVNDRRSWRQVIDRLAPRHRCIAPDARGYGETEYEPEDGWSPVADTLAVLDDAGATDPAVVIACSMGGQTAVDLALAHPDRVAGLLLIGTAIRGAPYPELTEGPTFELNARFEEAEAAEDLEELERLDAWMWLDGPSSPEGRVGGATRKLFLEMNGCALRAPDPGAQAELPDAWARLGEISVPTLILIGRLDTEELLAIDELAAGLIPGAQLRYLDGVAHVPHLEGDAATLDEIVAFVDSLAPAGE
jgi:pimeloyl-ACP methyl ester carboxylesterase